MLRKLAGMIFKRSGTTGQEAPTAAGWQVSPDDWRSYFPAARPAGACACAAARRAAEVASLEALFAAPAFAR